MSPRIHIPRRELGAVLAIAALTMLAAPARAAGTCATEAAWGANRSDLAAQVVTLANEYRAGRGLAQLAPSEPLTASSAWKSLHMAANGYFAHDDPAPVSRSAFQRARDCGFSGSAWGENIASGYGSPQAVMEGWVNSPGHRANLENPAYTTIGVGVAQTAGGVLYWTQNFGNDTPVAAPPTLPAQPAPATPAPAGATPAPASPRQPVSPHAAQGSGVEAPEVPAPEVPAPDEAPASEALAGRAVAREAARPAGPATPIRVRAATGGRARPGATLVASVAPLDPSTGLGVDRGDVRCRATIGGIRLAVVVNAVRGGRATCGWRVPEKAAGRRVTGTVALRSGAATYFGSFTRTVR